MAELDEGIQDWAELEQMLRARWPLSSADADLAERRDVARRVADTLAAATALPPTDACRIREIEVDASAPADAPRAPFARVYEPADHDGPLPTQLFLHGGGFVFGSARELINDSVLAARTAATGIRHVSLAYSLAPEHPFPTARDQAVRVFDELHERAEELGIDPERLGLGGNSAGASIIASAALALERRAAAHGSGESSAAREGGTAGGTPPRPHHLFLEVPAVSLNALHELAAGADDTVSSAIEAEYAKLIEQYRPALDGSAFVADAEDLPPFPPTLILAAEHDPLRSGASLLAARLRELGTPVREHVVPGTQHASAGITRTSPAARRWQQIIVEDLADAYETGAR
ncbi:hypothetical protein DEO23_01140 [Brachybacterium endophyticum]|uniref:Alpha/beta hydrolase fold-3 domain-containing protein n=1 Tax=Brachybacterium endophyticum TaxID=2182385 RepID=A0A2U2RN39_9MICO|nr:alpha/beta hydrolase [Brachybacterium endophyticum]PWH07289.1 hypothetical protein DEO23_01140 [Brachybacterium endophyticum]